MSLEMESLAVFEISNQARTWQGFVMPHNGVAASLVRHEEVPPAAGERGAQLINLDPSINPSVFPSIQIIIPYVVLLTLASFLSHSISTLTDRHLAVIVILFSY